MIMKNFCLLKINLSKAGKVSCIVENVLYVSRADILNIFVGSYVLNPLLRLLYIKIIWKIGANKMRGVGI